MTLHCPVQSLCLNSKDPKRFDRRWFFFSHSRLIWKMENQHWWRLTNESRDWQGGTEFYSCSGSVQHHHHHKTIFSHMILISITKMIDTVHFFQPMEIPTRSLKWPVGNSLLEEFNFTELIDIRGQKVCLLYFHFVDYTLFHLMIAI